MNTPYTKHEMLKIDELTSKGYNASYKLENGKLKDLQSGKLFSAAQVIIIEMHRYEGMSNPSDLSILYALKTEDGGKGTLLLPYGPLGDSEMAWFMKEVPTVTT